MQIFIPYPSPIDVAKCLDKARLNKQVIEASQIIKTITGFSQAWQNHPIMKMYKKHQLWVLFYWETLYFYQYGDIDEAIERSEAADRLRPPFITGNLCDQHKRRLYTKSPNLYPQFAPFGKSEENWYIVDGELLKYINGKQVCL